MTTPTEFVLWLNGATGLLGDEAPSPEQWARIQEKLGEAIGKITADRLLERADEQIKLDQERLEKDLKVQAMREQAKSQMAAMMAQQMDVLTMKHLALEESTKAYTLQIDQLRNRGIASAQQAGMAALAGRVTEIPPASRLNPFGALRKKSAIR